MNPTDILARFGTSAALAAALRTGLLLELTKGKASVAELSSRLSLDPRATGLILDLLASDGLVRRDDDGFVMGDVLLRMAEQPGGYQLSLTMWAHTETFLRTGEPFVQMDLAPAQREQAYQNVVGGLGRMFEGVANELASKLPITPTKILDVGCGSGVWSLAIANRHAQAHVTGLDFPAVLENFSARAAKLELGHRTATIAGDMHAVAVPAGQFDLVVIANVLRLDVPERAAALVKRLAPAVKPGGALLVIDALATGSPERDRARLVYALHLGLRTKEGQVHNPATITSWLSDAGLERVEPVDVSGGMGGIGGLLAWKP